MAKNNNIDYQSNQKVWFISIRGSYLPANFKGWLMYIPYLSYLIFTLIVGIKYTSSILLAILVIVPNWVVAAIIMTFIAARKS